MRVVSLACSNTEIICALGRAHLLVGVDDHSDFPVEVVSKLPRVGPDLEIDIERVAALQPDLVLASLTVPGHERVVAGLEAAGLSFLSPEPLSLADVQRDIRDIGCALDATAEAEDLMARMEKELAPVAEPESRPRILVEWWPKPVIAPGRQSWVHEMIDRAGGVNPLGIEPIKSRPLEDPEVAEIDPHAFVLSWCGVEPEKVRPEVVLRNPAFRDTAAVRNGQVHCVPEALLGRPGPRLIEGYRELRKIVESSRSLTAGVSRQASASSR